jgi:tRNA (guanine37-N1)-methyltransferase
VLGNEESLEEETHEDGDAEYPQYTRPREFRGMKVPDILFSGDHEEIRKWKEKNKRKIGSEEDHGHHQGI